jgi:hypothetical protein
MLGSVRIRSVSVRPLLYIAFLFATACGPSAVVAPTPDVEGTVSVRVRATVAAIPTPVPATPVPPTLVPTTPPTATSQPSVAAVPPSTSTAPESNPVETARRFYGLISSKNLRAAWALQSPNRQSSLQYDSWVAAYRTTRSVEANVTPREQTNSRATVGVSITAVDAQDAGTITKTFEGTWNLVLLDNAWRLDTASIVETTASPTRSPVATAASSLARATATLQPRLAATPTTAPLIAPYYGSSGCGSRGGPGYRLPSGKCASWRDAGR